MEPPWSAAAVALSLPEILGIILGFYFTLEDWRDLLEWPASAAPLQVSSLWFDCGIEHLWSARDACIHLLAVSPERRQIYASKMRYMNVWYANEHRHWLAFEGLKFRRLKHFTATVSSILPFGILTHMMDYCVRSLQTFDFNGPHVSADLLGLLQDNCPNLKHA